MSSRSYAALLRTAVLVCGDAATAGLGVMVSIILERARLFGFPTGIDLTRASVMYVVSVLLALALAGFYATTQSARHRPSLAIALVLQFAIVGAWSTLLAFTPSRPMLVIVLAGESLLLPGWRRLHTTLWPLPSHRVTLLGSRDRIQRLMRDGEALRQGRLSIAAIVTTDGPFENTLYVGEYGSEAADRALETAEAVLDVGSSRDRNHHLELLSRRGPRGFWFVPLHSEALLASSDFVSVGDHVIASVTMRGAHGGGAWIKRLFDVIVASIAFVVTLPLLIVAMLAIAVTSGGPVFLLQERVGKGGRTFRMAKLRTMADADRNETGADDDGRVTRVGRILRRHRIDELPQLVQVITGNMSLVGPRPELPELTERITAAFPPFALRLHGLPGVAGLAQVSAESDQSPETKLAFDLQYLCSWSLWQDVRIAGRAVSTALSGRGL